MRGDWRHGTQRLRRSPGGNKGPNTEPSREALVPKLEGRRAQLPEAGGYSVEGITRPGEPSGAAAMEELQERELRGPVSLLSAVLPVAEASKGPADRDPGSTRSGSPSCSAEQAPASKLPVPGAP